MANLKQFDEWLDKTNKGAGIWTTAAYKKAWIAALEWLYIDMTSYDSTQVRDMINKELGNDD